MGIKTFAFAIGVMAVGTGVAHAAPARPPGPVAPPPAPVLVNVKPPVPVASPATWVMPNDYPSQAMRNGETGTVRFLLHVDASGGVSNCAVTSSSGVAALDAVTCDVVSRRARFHSARDRLGRPVSGTYANAIRWQIPQGNLAPTDRQITGTFVVERDGSVRDCRLVTFQSEDQKALKGDAAASLRDHTERTFCTAQVNYLPYRDASGAPVSKRVTITQIVKTEALKD